MRVLLLAPPMPFSGRVPMAPPILEYLGALTLREAPDTELVLVDADAEALDTDAVDAELVGISAMTATAAWAYSTADALRARGVRVVLGGIHPTALPDEAARHANAVVVGEAESVWGELLRDAAAGRMRERYVGERLPLAGLPKPLSGRLRGPYRFRALFTARGCPYRCTFCSVRRFFGDSIRYRPVNEVVDEVEACLGTTYFNGDDNIWGGDPARSIEMFRALGGGAKKRWYGFGDLGAVQGSQGEAMLSAAKASGLFSVWAGWESSSADDLKAYHATGKQGRDREDAVRRIKSHGIDVTLFVVLGSRADSLDDFRRTVELADRLGTAVHPVLLTPLPGTELFAEYEPFLLPGIGWDRFTGTRAVFEHPTLTAVERERAYFETSLELLSPSRIARHLGDISFAGFPATHALSLMKALPMRRAMRKAYDEWKLEEAG